MEGLQYEICDFLINRNIMSFDKTNVYTRKHEHELEIHGAILSVLKHPHVDQNLFVFSISSARFIRSSSSIRVWFVMCLVRYKIKGQ